MTAAMLGVGERISSELMHPPWNRSNVRSEKGYVVLNAVGPDSVLVVLTTRIRSSGGIHRGQATPALKWPKALQASA